jgi:hypothetical protein
MLHRRSCARSHSELDELALDRATPLHETDPGHTLGPSGTRMLTTARGY